MAAEAANGKKLFTPDEIRSMLEKAGMPLRVMILLGINGALGNSDCSRLPVKAVDLERAIIEFNRPKTGAERVVPLWPETVNALREVLASRPTAASPGTAELVFLTKFGHPWVRETVYESANKGITKVVAVDSVGQEFNKLLTELGLKRKGIGFYTLRHTFRTWADEAKDQHAIHRIMGHTIPGMSGVYVEEISLERLRAVVDLVHAKLFPPPKQEVSPTTA
jgi:integrase